MVLLDALVALSLLFVGVLHIVLFSPTAANRYVQEVDAASLTSLVGVP